MKAYASLLMKKMLELNPTHNKHQIVVQKNVDHTYVMGDTILFIKTWCDVEEDQAIKECGDRGNDLPTVATGIHAAVELHFDKGRLNAIKMGSNLKADLCELCTPSNPKGNYYEHNNFEIHDPERLKVIADIIKCTYVNNEA